MSGKKRAQNLVLLDDGETTEIEIDDPSTHKTIVYDLFDAEVSYEVLTYGTSITRNTFEKNFSGKRGTALLVEYVNEL